MKKISILCVGKLKDQNLKEIEKKYLQRLPGLEIIETKSYETQPKKELQEIQKILETFHHYSLFSLEENGTQFNSRNWAKWLQKKTEENSHLVGLIYGSYGRPDNFEVQDRISLSPLTFPHEIARLLLIEQIYRAHKIWEGHPYHHD